MGTETAGSPPCQCFRAQGVGEKEAELGSLGTFLFFFFSGLSPKHVEDPRPGTETPTAVTQAAAVTALDP